MKILALWLALLSAALIVVLVLGLLRLQNLTAELQEVTAENRRAAALACNAQNGARAAVADVFGFMEAIAAESSDEPRTDAEERRFRAFFDGVAERLRPVDCPH